ncbi:helix-turn-helix domain-containing protein [Deinococcus sp. UR1]|uniref:helix-turn-helix domain-containing protein n=1 Tax=Deinococcus sp. UR1 TaxID=1704277 RepID=UPI0006DC5699|nr:helix-turn-helix transcriptional regulator [Deinococcus sp. UR1]PIG98904.1 XRE family transcriptional regulator [Deinococcus sp. UR1]
MTEHKPPSDWRQRRQKPHVPPPPPNQPLTPREWLRRLRAHHDLTIEEVTKRINQYHPCTKSFLDHLEGGRVSIPNLSAEKKDALQRVFNLTEEEWAHGTSGTATMKDIK